MKAEGQNAGAAPRDAGSASAKIAIGMVALVLVVLLVLPGFLMAGFSRMNGTVWSMGGDLDWDATGPFSKMEFKYQVEAVVTAPAFFVMRHSVIMHRFYNWQYRVAGGLDVP